QVEYEGPNAAPVVLAGGAGANNAEGAPAGGGRGGYDWCNNGGPGRGFGDSTRAPTSPNANDSTRTPPKLTAERPGLYRSENKGRTWTLVSNCDGRPLYFSNIRVDPTNDKTIYVANTRAAKSVDGGKTFVNIDEGLGYGNENVDQHAYWID